MSITMEMSREYADSLGIELRPVTRYPAPPDKTMYVGTFAVGMVVDKREMNGYDDSDFYATYYDPDTDSFKEIEYASTRGWTYLNGASIDATEEIEAKYSAHLLKKSEDLVALRRQWAENAVQATCDKLIELAGDTEQVRGRLSHLMGKSENWKYILGELNKAKRSAFRLSLQKQVACWLSDLNPKYSEPLSGPQKTAILRYQRPNYYR